MPPLPIPNRMDGDVGSFSATTPDVVRRHGAPAVLSMHGRSTPWTTSWLHVSRGQWRLAPAFDINPFPDRVRELKTWISEETGPEATIDALMSVIAYFRLSRERGRTILAEVEGAVAAWRAEGRALGMTPGELDMFRDAFEHDERRAAQAELAR